MAKKAPTQGPNGNLGEQSPSPMVDVQATLGRLRDKILAAGSIPFTEVSLQPRPLSERQRAVLFSLEDTLFGLDIGHVVEVRRQVDITPVPMLPGWVLGVMNLQGDIVSVVDLSQFIGMKRESQYRDGAVIVTQAADQKIGLFVDRVLQILAFETEQIISPPFSIEAALVPFLRGAVDYDSQFIRLLDCERLLLGPQMQQFA